MWIEREEYSRLKRLEATLEQSRQSFDDLYKEMLLLRGIKAFIVKYENKNRTSLWEDFMITSIIVAKYVNKEGITTTFFDEKDKFVASFDFPVIIM